MLLVMGNDDNDGKNQKGKGDGKNIQEPQETPKSAKRRVQNGTKDRKTHQWDTGGLGLNCQDPYKETKQNQVNLHITNSINYSKYLGCCILFKWKYFNKYIHMLIRWLVVCWQRFATIFQRQIHISCDNRVDSCFNKE